MHPLLFRPIYRRYLWGGRGFATRLGRDLPPGDDYAESWEVVDRSADQSVVAAGPFAGRSLGELVRAHGAELLGRHAGLAAFPLLFKFLDARSDLSVQVHPDDARAALLDPPDRGKTEAWYVIDAAPGARLAAGGGSVGRAIARQKGTSWAAFRRLPPPTARAATAPASGRGWETRRRESGSPPSRCPVRGA